MTIIIQQKDLVIGKKIGPQSEPAGFTAGPLDPGQVRRIGTYKLIAQTARVLGHHPIESALIQYRRLLFRSESLIGLLAPAT